MRSVNLGLAIPAIVLDYSAIVLGLLAAYHIRAPGATDLYAWPYERYLVFVLLIAPVALIVLAKLGSYRPRSIPIGWHGVSKYVSGLLISWGLLLILLYLLRFPETQVLPRLLIVYGILLTILFGVFGKIFLTVISLTLSGFGRTDSRTVVVSNRITKSLADKIAHGHYPDRTVTAVIDDQKIIAQLNSLYSIKPFDEVIFIKSSPTEAATLEVLNWCQERDVRFGFLPDFFNTRISRTELVSVSGFPVLFLNRTPLEGWLRIVKRLVDIVLSLVLLIVTAPLQLIGMLLVKISSPGPIIIAQDRVSQDGRIFKIHKLRSMYQDADQRFPEYRNWSNDEEKDRRITPVGRFLRRTFIDELPQLVDVLLGRMSLVGPRPEQPQYVALFSDKIPEYLRRHYVKSGLTGWAQINGLRGNHNSIDERVHYDLYYIENWSLILDLRIILITSWQFLVNFFRR